MEPKETVIPPYYSPCHHVFYIPEGVEDVPEDIQFKFKDAQESAKHKYKEQLEESKNQKMIEILIWIKDMSDQALNQLYEKLLREDGKRRARLEKQRRKALLLSESRVEEHEGIQAL